MEDRNSYNSILDAAAQDKTMAKSFMANVFSYMFMGLLITGIISWYFADAGLVEKYLITETGASPLYYIAAFAPLGFVFLMSLGYNKLSASSMLILFITFATLMGVSLSTIFLRFSGADISTAFFSASSVFAIMAVVGYTTTTDLTKLGNILYIGLIGIIVAMIANFFMQSSMMSYVISVIGVIIFTGLTAYDVQKLKRIGEGAEIGTASTKKRAIYGALDLYLDFINLFLFLLRLFGGRD